VGSVTSRAIQSRHESTRLRLIPQQRFSSLEELSAAVTRAVRTLNKSDILNGIANLPKRWEAVVAKQGDYIEGL
jgi:Ribonuclease G/E